jgi:hypothetical protein
LQKISQNVSKLAQEEAEFIPFHYVAGRPGFGKMPASRLVLHSFGCFSFLVDDDLRMKRFLVMGVLPACALSDLAAQNLGGNQRSK